VALSLLGDRAMSLRQLATTLLGPIFQPTDLGYLTGIEENKPN